MHLMAGLEIPSDFAHRGPFFLSTRGRGPCLRLFFPCHLARLCLSTETGLGLGLGLGSANEDSGSAGSQREFTTEEVKKCKNRKAAGADQKVNAFMKYGAEGMLIMAG